MTAGIYFLAAVISTALATRAWLLDREAPGRRDFMWLGWTLAVSYLLFALSFLPQARGLEFLVSITACVVAPHGFATLDAVFPPQRTWRNLGRRLTAFGYLVGIGSFGTRMIFAGTPIARLAHWTATGWIFVAVLLVLWRIWTARRHASSEVERSRIGWLYGLTWAAMLLTFAEWLSRLIGPMPDRSSLEFFERGLVLNGLLPPISSLLAVAVMYVVYHSMLTQRMVALRQLLVRVMAVCTLAAVLVLSYAVFLRGMTLVRFPLHSSFLVFLLSAVFLSVADALRRPLETWLSHTLNPGAQQLGATVSELKETLPLASTPEELAQLVATQLLSSGRFAAVSVYLYSGRAGACIPKATAPTDAGVLQRVALAPFDQFFHGGPRWCSVQRGETRWSCPDDATANLVASMHADVLMRLYARGELLGWVTLRDISVSDGFDVSELQLVAGVCDLSAASLANMSNIVRQQEQRRLAMLGTVSAGLAHEIRNPLAGLKGAAQVLQGEELPDHVDQMLRVIVTETDRLNDVVTQFLDYARPMKLRRKPVDLGHLLHHVVQLTQAQGLPEDLQLDLTTEPELPPTAGDAGRISQVVLNLIQNAQQAVGPYGHILVSARTAHHAVLGDVVQIEVRDDGPGISQEALEQAFTPFFTTRPSGTGLGLPISRRIAEAHGGRLVGTNLPTGGACFVLSLPVERLPALVA